MCGNLFQKYLLTGKSGTYGPRKVVHYGVKKSKLTVYYSKGYFILHLV